jgi:hypothetical protein
VSWLSELFTAGAGALVKEIGDAIDKNVTNDEERATLHVQLTAIKAKTFLASKELDLKYETEISGRHMSDMKSDDIWSKRIRPMSMAFLLAVVTVLSVSDGNIPLGDGSYVSIGVEYIDLFRSLLITAFAFYFGGRSMEKIYAIRSNNNKPKGDTA